MGVKFILHAKFHPIGATVRVPPKLKVLLRFDQNVEYKHPAGAYPLRDFHKICRICTPFQNALAVELSLDLLKGLWSYGGFKLTVSGYPKIFSAPYRQNCASDPPKVLEVQERLEVLYHHAKFGGARISPAAGAAKDVQFFVCLFVYLSVTLLNVRVCTPDFAMKALE